MAEQFISEPIEPEPGAFRPETMASGLAALPAAFTWRGRRYAIAECLEHVKVTSTEGRRAQGDRYLRRQAFLVRLESGETARIYIERHARPGASRKSAKQRWFLYSIVSGDDQDPGPHAPRHIADR